MRTDGSSVCPVRARDGQQTRIYPEVQLCCVWRPLPVTNPAEDLLTSSCCKAAASGLDTCCVCHTAESVLSSELASDRSCSLDHHNCQRCLYYHVPGESEVTQEAQRCCRSCLQTVCRNIWRSYRITLNTRHRVFMHSTAITQASLLHAEPLPELSRAQHDATSWCFLNDLPCSWRSRPRCNRRRMRK